MTTADEWRAMILFMDSTDFKGIVDYMSTDEILGVWGFFEDYMSDKFINGLSLEDKMDMTTAEWEASYIGMSPSDFKTTFFDEMNAQEIMQVCEKICQSFGNINGYVEGLTVKDWLHMTRDEWQAFFVMADVDYMIEFVHSSHSVEPKIVYHMFKNMPHDMLEDFEHTPELHEEFDQYETETIRRGIRDNVSRIESVFDITETEAEPEYEPEQTQKRQGGKKHGGKKHGGKKHDGKKHGDKHHDGKPNKRDGKRHHHDERMEPEFERHHHDERMEPEFERHHGGDRRHGGKHDKK